MLYPARRLRSEGTEGRAGRRSAGPSRASPGAAPARRQRLLLLPLCHGRAAPRRRHAVADAAVLPRSGQRQLILTGGIRRMRMPPRSFHMHRAVLMLLAWAASAYAATPTLQNLVLVTLDTTRADHL